MSALDNIVPGDSYLSFSVPHFDEAEKESLLANATIDSPPTDSTKKTPTAKQPTKPQAKKSAKKGTERDLEAQTKSEKKECKHDWVERIFFMFLMFCIFVLVVAGLVAILQAIVGEFCYLIWPERYPPLTPVCHAVSEAKGSGLLVSVKCE